MINSKSPSTGLHIPRLKMSILHRLQSFQMPNSKRILFILDRLSGRLVLRPTTYEYHPRPHVQSTSRWRLVHLLQVRIHATLLIIEPPDLSQQRPKLWKASQVHRFQEVNLAIPHPPNNQLLERHQLVIASIPQCLYVGLDPVFTLPQLAFLLGLLVSCILCTLGCESVARAWIPWSWSWRFIRKGRCSGGGGRGIGSVLFTGSDTQRRAECDLAAT